jgi:calcineurin-like phosphoesterase family protein
MRVLAVSDKVIPFIYSPQVRQRFDDVDLVISCGDLPVNYLEYIIDALDVPLVYVRGNHDESNSYYPDKPDPGPRGALDLHGTSVMVKGELLAGIQGCLWYRPGLYQYTQREMWLEALRLVPGLLLNRMRYGRYLDVLVTHAPSWGLHDLPDLPHQGLKAFRWLVMTFQPAYHLHGHVHVYSPQTVTHSELGRTQVINVYGFRQILTTDVAGQPRTAKSQNLP